MATRIDLHIDQVRNALNLNIASTKRALNNQPNKLIKEILQKDLAALETANNTLQEIK